MSNLTKIKDHAEAELHSYVDANTPEGHFAVHTVVLGIPTTYLLEGSLDAPQEASIVGRVEVLSRGGVAYRGSGIKGGEYVGANKGYALLNQTIVG